MTKESQFLEAVQSSRVAAILGSDPHKSSDDVTREMVRSHHSEESEFSASVVTEYSRVNRDSAQMAYEIQEDCTVERCGVFMYEGWLRARPDGLVGDGIVKFRTPYNGKITPLTDQMHYYDNIQAELLCSGRKWCHFVQWVPGGPLSVSLVVADPFWREDNVPKLRDFYAQCLLEADNPEHLEPKRIEITSIRAQQLADEYDELRGAIDRSKERQKDIISELSEISKGKDAIIGDYNFTKVTRKGSVSYGKVVKEHCPHIDLKYYTGKPSEYWVLK